MDQSPNDLYNYLTYASTGSPEIDRVKRKRSESQSSDRSQFPPNKYSAVHSHFVDTPNAHQPLFGSPNYTPTSSPGQLKNGLAGTEDGQMSLMHVPSPFGDQPLSLWSPSTVSVFPHFKDDTLPADFDSAFSHITEGMGLGGPDPNLLAPRQPSSINTHQPPLLNKQEATIFEDFLGKFLDDSEELLDPKTVYNLSQNQFTYGDADLNYLNLTHSTSPKTQLQPEIIKPQHVPEEIDEAESSSAASDKSKTASKRGSRKEIMSAEQKRLNHISAEKKRRALCRQYVDDLCTLTPKLAEPPDGKGSAGRGRGRSLAKSSKTKSEMLSVVRDYIVELIEENKKLRQGLENCGLEVQVKTAE